MEMIGGEHLIVYPKSDDFTHEAENDPQWQESFLLHFWDHKMGVGGYMRIGHEPHVNGGQFLIYVNLVSPDGIFHRVDVVPKMEGDVSHNGIRCDGGALCCKFDNNNVNWSVLEVEAQADLILTDHHAPVDCYPKSREMSRYVPSHIDVSCTVSGKIVTKGNSYEIHALGMRDHGWGVREWNKLITQRWVYGVFDSQNSFYAVGGHTKDDKILKFGWVQRDNKMYYTERCELVGYVEVDGVSNRGGFVRMELTTGEIFEAHLEAVTRCITFWLNNTLVVDNFCKVRWGNKIGVGNFETNCNIMRGTHRPKVFDAGTIDEMGWHPS